MNPGELQPSSHQIPNHGCWGISLWLLVVVPRPLDHLLATIADFNLPVEFIDPTTTEQATTGGFATDFGISQRYATGRESQSNHVITMAEKYQLSKRLVFLDFLDEMIIVVWRELWSQGPGIPKGELGSEMAQWSPTVLNSSPHGLSPVALGAGE